MTWVFRWRVPEPEVATLWRGSGGMQLAVTRSPQTTLAAIVGPPGPAGPQGPSGPAASLRIDAALSATWILDHGLGKVPIVQVFLPSGEPVLADVIADERRITVTHSAPKAGFVLVV